MSVQTWHLVPKIREVDAVADDPRLVEVHPELAFAALAGTGPLASKKTAGRPGARGWRCCAAGCRASDDGAGRRRRAGRAGRGLVGAAMAGRRGPGRCPSTRRTTSAAGRCGS